jgi:hypothetical protein
MYVDLSVPNFSQDQLRQIKRYYSLNKVSVGAVRLKNLVIFDLKNHKKRCVFIDEKTYEFVLKTLAD